MESVGRGLLMMVRGIISTAVVELGPSFSNYYYTPSRRGATTRDDNGRIDEQEAMIVKWPGYLNGIAKDDARRTLDRATNEGMCFRRINGIRPTIILRDENT